ncbi:MAG TPA: cation:proton antiporter [Thermoleophilaceae bacterium]|nr:cation:proton antiporter [Thermoleophilaceae bacterium]
MAEDALTTPPRRRLVAFYVVLAVVTAVVSAVVLTIGSDEEAQPSIAAKYKLDQPHPCLGGEFDVRQSGQYVQVSNQAETLDGKLRFKDGELSGDVDCVDGEKRELDGVFAVPRAAAESGEEKPEKQLQLSIDGGETVIPAQNGDPPRPGSTKPRVPSSIHGEYRLSPRSACLGGRLELKEEGHRVLIETLRGKELGGVVYDSDKGTLEGEIETCAQGGAAPAPPEITGTAVNRELTLTLAGEKVKADKEREFGKTLAAFFIAVAVVMLFARLMGIAATKLGQPRVMGEVVAGIALGPTLLGALAPGVQNALFPIDIIPFIGVVANLGLIFYMFLVGLELDPKQLEGRAGQAAAVSNASVALPMMLGIAVALPIYALVGPPGRGGDTTNFVPFAIFMGVAMSITAFPVLARILVERRMLKRPVGALTMACAAIDDITAWFLIALAIALGQAEGSVAVDVIRVIALAAGFCAVMFLLAKPLLGRVSNVYDEVGRIPGGWIVAIFAGILLSAYVTEEIGIALIIGAFVMGAIMPRHAGLTEDVTHRIEDFVVLLLLPLFFAYTGLRTNMNLLDRPELIFMTLALIAVAITGKLLGAYIAARLTGLSHKASAVIGTLMNTRGLTELIVLNIALDIGVISEALFAMLVIMALVTTFMAGPLLNLLDPSNEFGAPVEEELVEAREKSRISFPSLAVPDKAILVAPQSDTGLTQLLQLAEPLAQSEPPRELVLARLVKPPRGSDVRGGLQTQSKLLRDASEEVHAEQARLAEAGIASRAVATISTDPGVDLAALAKEEEVDLLLADGRRPLLGEGVPRGEIGVVLHQAPCDVAVLVAKEGTPVDPGPDSPVIVPFGQAEHDWAALELGAWIAAAKGAPLKLLGAAGSTDEGPRVERMLGDAGILVQQYAGITAEPVVADAGREAILEQAAKAGLLVIGLSERWQKEGLGAVRSDIARAASAPTIFVRRGSRPGALAPAGDVTRFTWSMAGGPPPGGLTGR